LNPQIKYIANRIHLDPAQKESFHYARKPVASNAGGILDTKTVFLPLSTARDLMYMKKVGKGRKRHLTKL